MKFVQSIIAVSTIAYGATAANNIFTVFDVFGSDIADWTFYRALFETLQRDTGNE
jgi:hypothetical protein